MFAELEYCRRLADLKEIPFTMIQCSPSSGVWPNALRSTVLSSLADFGDILGTIGMLDTKRMGIVINTTRDDEVCKIATSIHEILGERSCDIKAYGYPYALEGVLLLPNSKGQCFSINGGSLQPFFALATPWTKRAIDFLAAAFGLLLTLPLFTLVAVLIRCSSRGPVFFRQRRIGRGGVPFYILKFRTMVENAEKLQVAIKHLSEQDGPAFKMKADPRVTPIGRVLRFTCIDELPQLWNVLKGEMSLVGPRPLPSHESNDLQWWQRRRLDVLPGITCTWQARGRSMTSFDEWMRLDLDYIRRWSVVFDLQIIFATFTFLLSRSSKETQDEQLTRSNGT